ncbi:MAG: hypothetical protein HYV16_01520 [Gammaproteobacteria bacterium]|nr:hypothetical protein [Gammaproteobacteria bacterium]
MSPEPHRWHQLSAAEVAALLDTDPSTGLGALEAMDRHRRFGPNAIVETQRRGIVRILAAQFADVMILVLIAAGIVAGVIGEPQDSVAIAVIVLLDALIGGVQRAEHGMRSQWGPSRWPLQPAGCPPKPGLSQVDGRA